MADGAQYLTFTLGDEEYGVEIMRVQELKGAGAFTRIPHTPPHVRGVMNLRGTVVPILDLRSRFGLAGAEPARFPVVVVVTLGARVCGLLVDSVCDVLDVDPAQVSAPPDLGASPGSGFVSGIAHAAGRLIVLLDLDQVCETQACETLEVPAGEDASPEEDRAAMGAAAGGARG